MPRQLIAGNWKMNMTASETDAFLAKNAQSFSSSTKDVILFVPFTSLACASRRLEGTGIALGAQNLHPEPKGAYTGEISAAMLADLGASSVLVGHSERRTLFAEDNAFLLAKLRAASSNGLAPVFCVGERLEARQAGETYRVLSEQLSILSEFEFDEKLTIAYEPVWAIGTGLVATPEQACEACTWIANGLESFYPGKADSIRVLYGGSVTADNAPQLLAQPAINGALVGGASLKEDFAKIVAA